MSMRGGRWLVKLGVWACLGGVGPVAMAQSPQSVPMQAATIPMGEVQTADVQTVAGVRCGCGRWTCPACQQQRWCQPGWSAEPCPPEVLGETMPGAMPPGSAFPGELVPPLATSPSDATNYQLSDGGDTPPLTPPTAGPAAADLFAANMGGGGVGGFGSSLRGATTPEMMGDFFGPGGVPSVFTRYDNYSYSTLIPSGGYALGRMKLAENNSPIPRDRVFFNYSLFTGVPLATPAVTVNRFSPGFEKTFWDGLASVELRTPFGTTLDNDVLANGMTSNNEFQFGNLFVALKGVLLEGQDWMLSGGASVLVPTAQDTRVIDPQSGEEFLRIANESTHLMPFLGGAYLPNDRWFAQWMVQCDIDANGNSVLLTEGGSRTKIGTLQDFTLLYTDINLGYWMYRAGPRSANTITGIAPVFEVHYNRALNSPDSVADANNIVANPLADFDNVNIQTGLIFNLRHQARLGLGYATPLGNTFDRVFDNEFRVTFNRYF